MTTHPPTGSTAAPSADSGERQIIPSAHRKGETGPPVFAAPSLPAAALFPTGSLTLRAPLRLNARTRDGARFAAIPLSRFDGGSEGCY